MQEVVDIGSLILLWAAGIICFPIMKKVDSSQYKAYIVYGLTVCVVVTIFAILYLCQR